jgi:hypothetical protein
VGAPTTRPTHAHLFDLSCYSCAHALCTHTLRRTVTNSRAHLQSRHVRHIASAAHATNVNAVLLSVRARTQSAFAVQHTHTAHMHLSESLILSRAALVSAKEMRTGHLACDAHRAAHYAAGSHAHTHTRARRHLPSMTNTRTLPLPLLPSLTRGAGDRSLAVCARAGCMCDAHTNTARQQHHHKHTCHLRVMTEVAQPVRLWRPVNDRLVLVIVVVVTVVKVIAVVVDAFLS